MVICITGKFLENKASCFHVDSSLQVATPAQSQLLLGPLDGFPLHRPQEKFCSVPEAPPALILHCLQGCFSHILSLLSPRCCCTAVVDFFFFHFLNLFSQRFSSGQHKSLLELVGAGSFLTWASFWSLHRRHLCSSPATKPLPHKCNTPVSIMAC